MSLRHLGSTSLGNLLLATATTVLSGCADASYPSSDKSAAYSGTEVGSYAAASAPSPAMAGATASMPKAEKQAQGEPVPKEVRRKIVYNANISLIVDSITALEQRVAELIKSSGGYVSESDVASQNQVQRRATWKVRVPVENFDTFVAAVARLGELQQNRLDSQDVTQEYYDIEARIKNKQQEEKRLQKHLDDSTGKLEDILAVERELTRVRGEVEQMQGRIRYLANVTALSTVTITAVEIKNYTPPAAPTFGTQIGRTFSNSVENLARFGRGLTLAVVAITPWLPLVVIASLPILLILRRERANRRRGVTARAG